MSGEMGPVTPDRAWLAVVKAVKEQIESQHCMKKIPIDQGAMTDLAALARRTYEAETKPPKGFHWKE